MEDETFLRRLKQKNYGKWYLNPEEYSRKINLLNSELSKMNDSNNWDYLPVTQTFKDSETKYHNTSNNFMNTAKDLFNEYHKEKKNSNQKIII